MLSGERGKLESLGAIILGAVGGGEVAIEAGEVSLQITLTQMREPLGTHSLSGSRFKPRPALCIVADLGSLVLWLK